MGKGGRQSDARRTRSGARIYVHHQGPDLGPIEGRYSPTVENPPGMSNTAQLPRRIQDDLPYMEAKYPLTHKLKGPRINCNSPTVLITLGRREQ
ncbi:hypothetical protein E2C01_018899 [Portunus trituberculatus]|uniref:Uncharacterized protein n=1 Tax=Portunus trituberculatus TaxID=210409 RepID=A0A5B7DXL8_PORTR|nr:hypothetical protein [Portunus trituberculatus]